MMRPSQFNSGLMPVVNTQPRDNDFLRIRLCSSIPASLQSYECPFNWIQLHPSCPLSLAELGHGVLILADKFRDESAEIINQLRSPPSTKSVFLGISLIANKFTQVYFNMELQRYVQARQCLEEAEAFIRQWAENNPNPDYSQGFQYILEGLQVFLDIQLCTASPTTTGGGSSTRKRTGGSGGGTPDYSLEGLKHFRRLPAKTKYIVWTCRDVFLIYCSRANVERTDWMEATLMEMEPYIPKWHFYLYRALHGHRKIVPRPMPLLLLDHAHEDAGSGKNIGAGAAGVVDDDPLSISYQCMCLAQIFKEKQKKKIITSSGSVGGRRGTNEDTFASGSFGGRGKNNSGGQTFNQYYPWRFGQHTFEIPDQVLECILEKTINVLELDCHLDGVYLNLSEVHMFILPPESRSMELTMRCLNKALRLNSNKPTTHHRLGLAYFKLKNHKQAIYHFREAIQNPNNIGAIFGLLQLLMANPQENSTEIQSIFKLTMKNPELLRVWDKRCLRTLHYLKGCFHFMMGLPLHENNKYNYDKDNIVGEDALNEAITSWIIAHDNESPRWSYYFLNLSHQSTRFQWPSKRLNLANVSNALKHAAYLERTQFRQLLLDICSEVDDAIRRCTISGGGEDL